MVTTDPLLRPLETIPNDEIVVHYQPVISIEDRTIRGVEALVRWSHPRHGLLKPDRFIPLAERSGAIGPLTWEVLRKVIDQHVAWKRDGLLLAVSVNISASFLTSPDVADDILALLWRKGFEPRQLTLEITETRATSNPRVARALLNQLRDAGVAVSMDDYGVGHSTLERLDLLPFSDLKIDRGLVAEIASSREVRSVVEGLITIAAERNLNLTAEGIETEEQWNTLKQLGCRCGQGFLIARPMPGHQVSNWIGEMHGRDHLHAAEPG